MELKDIINLSPNDFEMLISNLVEEQGYKVKRFAPGEDIGIDIVARDEEESIAKDK
ncbi:restriction endonuclease [Tissierella sp.]|uniref:restriction endonuclease n=1 Tax=Tissierella sp. TaxID=41274 RepID=UPI00285EF859|nr:restriction endonuclease [Tissierella sp.]MDR7855741.1 restriction endonuclease [Tissierella sp.]